jgi:fatty acid desaturase
MPRTSNKAGTLPGQTGSLRPQTEIDSALFTRSDYKGLSQLAVHLGALVLTSALIGASTGTPWLLPAMAIHGVVLVFLFSPLHECIHRTAFESRWINDALASVCGFLLLLPKEFFRAFHLTHHQHTQDPERDPELIAPKPKSLDDYLLQLSGLPYWRERIGTLMRHAAGRVSEPFIAERLRMVMVREARWHLALYAAAGIISVYADNSAVLIYWILPVVIGQPVLRAFLLAEHTGCPLVAGMLENSRTTHTNRLMKTLAWNMPYHAEHHAYAAIPFHALPPVHEILKESIVHQSRGYVAVHRDLRMGFRSTA